MRNESIGEKRRAAEDFVLWIEDACSRNGCPVSRAEVMSATAAVRREHPEIQDFAALKTPVLAWLLERVCETRKAVERLLERAWENRKALATGKPP